MCLSMRLYHSVVSWKKIVTPDWIQVDDARLTCVSVKRRESARFSLSQTDRYLVVLNLASSATNCSYVNAVRARRGLPLELLLLLLLLLLPLEWWLWLWLLVVLLLLLFSFTCDSCDPVVDIDDVDDADEEDAFLLEFFLFDRITDVEQSRVLFPLQLLLDRCVWCCCCCCCCCWIWWWRWWWMIVDDPIPVPVKHDDIVGDDALADDAVDVSRDNIASIENELHLNGVTLKSFGSDEEESRVTLSSIQLNKCWAIFVLVFFSERACFFIFSSNFCWRFYLSTLIFFLPSSSSSNWTSNKLNKSKVKLRSFVSCLLLLLLLLFSFFFFFLSSHYKERLSLSSSVASCTSHFFTSPLPTLSLHLRCLKSMPRPRSLVQIRGSNFTLSSLALFTLTLFYASFSLSLSLWLLLLPRRRPNARSIH